MLKVLRALELGPQTGDETFKTEPVGNTSDPNHCKVIIKLYGIAVIKIKTLQYPLYRNPTPGGVTQTTNASLQAINERYVEHSRFLGFYLKS